jgi:AcrR family transcriptional regulator
MPTGLRILAAARRVCAEEGVEAISLRKVARAAGLTAPAIYRHFATRERLLGSLAVQIFGDLDSWLLRARRGLPPLRRLEQMARHAVDYALEHPRHFELLFAAPVDRRHVGPALHFHAQISAARLETLLPPQEEAAALELWALIGGLVALRRQGVFAEEKAFRAHCLDAIRRFLRGLQGG